MVAKSKSSTRKAASTRKPAKKKASSTRAPVKAKAKTTAAKTTKKITANVIKATKNKQTSLQIITQISEAIGVNKKEVKAVFLELRNIVEGHIMKRGSGKCPIPELAITVKRHEKPARKARVGRNPATGEPVKIAAKPKQQVVKVQALKKLKEILAA